MATEDLACRMCGGLGTVEEDSVEVLCQHCKGVGECRCAECAEKRYLFNQLAE